MTLTPEETRLELQRIVERIAEALEPEKIILFGSRARGDARLDSDIDLLIITKDGDPHELSKAAFKAAKGRTIALDVVAVPRTYFEQRLREGSVFFKAVMKDSQVLYGA
jgi:uncharacterized protein